MKLEWKSYSDDSRQADGDQGTWRMVSDATGRWHLTIQPKWTRGMLSKGKFATRLDAEFHAQDRENDVPILPQRVEPS